MSRSTAQLRQLWRDFECKETSMVVVPFGPDRIRVAPPTVEAWDALAAVMLHHGYQIRTVDTDSYSCREITGGTGRSLHSYGVALDVNWTTNPFLDHPGTRKVRFSDKPTQDERARDVRHGRADTDMTPEMIKDVEAIKTNDGVQVFEWGGNFTTRKDAMHFQLDVSPAELAKGIDPRTVQGLEEADTGIVEEPEPVEEPVPSVQPGTGTDPHLVVARSGLRLRSAPSETADIIRTVPEGTQVNVLSREGLWALVDLQGDRQADGFMFSSFLRRVDETGGEAAIVVPEAHDVLNFCTPELVARMFPATPRRNIENNLPFVVAGLRARALVDRQMALMALATIRAETEGFVPISEGRSRFNTRVRPFDRYEGRADLGNTRPGDGARFKGRGYVQLTGRSNYTRVSRQVGSDLVANPDLANNPTVAGLILAQFLKNQERCVRSALANRNLRAARRCVNGGTHGLDRFVDAFERGKRALPA